MEIFNNIRNGAVIIVGISLTFPYYLYAYRNYDKKEELTTHNIIDIFCNTATWALISISTMEIVIKRIKQW
jgi:hypothetical protein